jgi:hypothetical protein
MPGVIMKNTVHQANVSSSRNQLVTNLHGCAPGFGRFKSQLHHLQLGKDLDSMIYNSFQVCHVRSFIV